MLWQHDTNWCFWRYFRIIFSDSFCWFFVRKNFFNTYRVKAAWITGLNLVFLLRIFLKTPSVHWLLRRRVSIIQTDVSDGMVYLMKLKQTMKMAQGTLEGAAQNFERLSVWKIECQNSKRDCFFLSYPYSILHNNKMKKHNFQSLHHDLVAKYFNVYTEFSLIICWKIEKLVQQKLWKSY